MPAKLAVPESSPMAELRTAVGLATMVIADGDEVEVNGTTGQVTVLKQAANGQG